MSEDEARRALAELASVPVEQLVVGTISTLVNVAFLRLGLIRGMEDAADSGQARRAIDAVAALEPVIAPSLPPGAADDLRRTVAELKLAYVKIVSEGDPAAAAAEPGDEASAPPPPPPRERPKIWTPRGDV